MGIAVGSSIQISLFVIPLLTVISWIASKPLSLLFDPFVAILLFLAVLIVNYAIADGRSNYMEGFVLMMVFLSKFDFGRPCARYQPLTSRLRFPTPLPPPLPPSARSAVMALVSWFIPDPTEGSQLFPDSACH